MVCRHQRQCVCSPAYQREYNFLHLFLVGRLVLRLFSFLLCSLWAFLVGDLVPVTSPVSSPSLPHLPFAEALTHLHWVGQRERKALSWNPKRLSQEEPLNWQPHGLIDDRRLTNLHLEW